jgi:vacuolar protein sorting-associated protein 45
MNVVAATRAYVDRVVSDRNNPGMKVLLLDAETTKTVANVYSQTEILERDVFLVERLDQTRSHEPMRHLKAAAFIRPTAANFALLRRELAEPKFGEYHLYFANVAPRAQLRELAESDDLEMVRQVQEFYADFVPINDALFTLNQRQSLRLSTTRPTADLLRRNVDGVLSCLLALKVQPACVRYSAASSVAKAIATEVSRRVKSDGIFHFKQRHSHETGWPLLLIMDRADDCVTPLLSQWTYQAMVHELLGVNNNRVRLKGTQSARGDPNLDEVVLHNTDAFYATHQHANFGDLGTAVKALLDDYQHQTKMNEHISNIEDMQSFLDRYPAFRSKSLNVSKHVALISELSKLVETHALMDISQLEQELACHDDGGTQRREVLARINDARVGGPDKLRLALLYALRYEQQGQVPEIKLALAENRVEPDRVALIDACLRYGGRGARNPGLFGGDTSLLAKVSKHVKTSLEGIENVYAQHVPLLLETLDAVAKNRLAEARYLCTGAAPLLRPAEVVVYIAGGATYEEATKVAELNALGGLRVVLGGSYVHNSGTFLEDLDDAYGRGGGV